MRRDDTTSSTADSPSTMATCCLGQCCYKSNRVGEACFKGRALGPVPVDALFVSTLTRCGVTPLHTTRMIRISTSVDEYAAGEGREDPCFSQ